MSIAEKYGLISQIGYITSLVFFILAIVLFFGFNIKKTIYDLMGITEKRAISRIREETMAKTDKEIAAVPSGNLHDMNETTLLQQSSITEQLMSVEQRTEDNNINFKKNGFRFVVIESIVITHSTIVI